MPTTEQPTNEWGNPIEYDGRFCTARRSVSKNECLNSLQERICTLEALLILKGVCTEAEMREWRLRFRAELDQIEATLATT